jgi:hypothetical protein
MAKKIGEESAWLRHGSNGERPKRHDLYRVPKKGVTGVVILSPDYLGRFIHYWGGRSMPHIEPNCPACRDGNDKRRTFWVAAWSMKTNYQAILEITDAAIASLDEYIHRYKTLRGAEVTAMRKGGRENGRLIVLLKPASIIEAAIPPNFDFRKELEHMWCGTNTLSRREGEANE